MHIFIIAAGSNSRFSPLNQVTHKGGIVLGGQSLLARTLSNLHEYGFDGVTIIVSEKDSNGQGLSAQIPSDFLGMNISFALQPTPKGMGDAILQVADQISDRFAVVYPYHTQAGTLLSRMGQRADQDVVAVTETSTPWHFGIVSTEGERAVGIVEKPPQGSEPSNLKVVGLYILSSPFVEILKSVPPEEYSFETALDQHMKSAQVYFHHLETSPPTLKYPWHLFNFQAQLFEKLTSFQSPDASINQSAVIDESKGPVFIDSGVSIGHAAKIVGPCYLGKNVLIGDFTTIRGSSVEANCRIGANTEVVRSIILESSDLHYSYLADSILGTKVKIGAGLITANKRLDRANLKMKVKGQEVDVGRNNLGIIVGNGAQLGVRVTTMPGVLIGSEAIVYPGSILYTSLDHRQVYKPSVS